jgi:hypothetical protein
MSYRNNRHLPRLMRGTVAVLVCTAVGDVVVAIVAIVNPEVAPIALGTIATLTTAGVAAAVPQRRSNAA